MGVIVRQSIKGSVYTYLGALLGFVNVGLLMPRLLDTDQIGLINLLLAITLMVSQFGSLGFTNVTTRLFPYFRTSDHTHHGFLRLLLLAGLSGLLLVFIGLFFARDYMVAQNAEKSVLFADNVNFLFPLIFVTLLSILLDAYFRVLYKASTSSFIRDLLGKSLICSTLILYTFGWLEFDEFLKLYVIAYSVPSILMIAYLIKIKEFSFKGSFKGLKPGIYKEILSIGMFGLVSGFSGIAVINIDKYMVNHFIDLDATGIYSTAFYFGTLILIPGKALRRISTSVLTDAFKLDDTSKVRDVYFKSSANMFLVAAGLFVLLWGNVHNVFKILPDDFADGRWVVFYIGLAYVFAMLSGVSGEIIQYSKYYRHHSLIMIVFIAIIVSSNILLIPEYGIVGAAMASAVSYFVYGIIRWLFVWRKFGLQPYGLKHLIIAVSAAGIFLISTLMPEMSLIPDLILRSGGIVLLFLVLLGSTNVSPEIRSVWKEILKKIKGIKS